MSVLLLLSAQQLACKRSMKHTNAYEAVDLHTYTHLTLWQQTHTHTHWDVVIGRASVSWEYESGCMTSSLFTGIRSSLSLTFPISTPPPSGCLSNHIDAVELVTRLVMSKAHLTTCFPYGGDLTNVTECFELKSPHFSLGIRLSFYWLCFRQCQLIWIVRDCCKGIKSQDQHHIIELLIVLHVK